MSGKLFDRVALIGIGLIGSSLARVLRRDCPETRIVACARTAETLDAVRRLDLADETTDDPAAAADGADLVVLATPLSAYREIAMRIAPSLRPGAIVTDVGSVKGVVIRDLAPLVPAGVHFVPGHPVAGTEHSGPEAGFAELFHDRWCILTPLPDGDAAALARVTALWEAAGEIPDLIKRWRGDEECFRELRSYLQEYDKHWNFPKLEEIFDKALNDPETTGPGR